MQKEKHVSSLTVENGQLMKEIDYLRSVREQSQGQMSEKLEKFEERVKQLVEERDNLYQKTADVVTERDQQEERVKQLVEERDSLYQKTADVVTERDQLEADNRRMKTEMEQALEVHSRLQEEYEQVTHVAHNTQTERESRIQALELQLSAVTEENSCLTDQMGQAEQCKCKLKAEVESLKETIASLTNSHDAEVKKHLNNIQELEKSLYISTNSNQRELNQLQSELSNMVKKKVEDNKLFTERMSKATSELQSERQIRQALEDEFNLLTGKCADLEATKLSLTQTIDR
jgi:chromosome segregation ATPase